MPVETLFFNSIEPQGNGSISMSRYDTYVSWSWVAMIMHWVYCIVPVFRSPGPESLYSNSYLAPDQTPVWR